MAESLTSDTFGGTLVITLYPEGRFPVLTLSVLDRLRQTLANEAQEARAVVIRGAKADFAAGADVRELAPMTSEQAYEFAGLGQEVCSRLENGPFVSIAELAGVALGGGTELALACDVRFCSPTVRLGETGVSLGIMAGWGGTRRLPRLIGEAAARDLLLSGRHIGAEEAYRLGLVVEVVDPDKLHERVMSYASDIGSKAPLSISATKRALSQAVGSDPRDADNQEARLFAELFKTNDTRHGLAAFMERRRPEFRGD